RIENYVSYTSCSSDHDNRSWVSGFRAVRRMAFSPAPRPPAPRFCWKSRHTFWYTERACPTSAAPHRPHIQRNLNVLPRPADNGCGFPRTEPVAMQVVILCGGQGTRIRDVAEDLPKPMIPIGGRPLLWHVMKGFAQHGVTD